MNNLSGSSIPVGWSVSLLASAVGSVWAVLPMWDGLALGPVATDLWPRPHGVAVPVGADGGQAPEAVATQAAAPMVTGRFFRPTEVADLMLVPAGDRFANVTGADFTIDGGMVTTLWQLVVVRARSVAEKYRSVDQTAEA